RATIARVPTVLAFLESCGSGVPSCSGRCTRTMIFTTSFAWRERINAKAVDNSSRVLHEIHLACGGFSRPGSWQLLLGFVLSIPSSLANSSRNSSSAQFQSAGLMMLFGAETLRQSVPDLVHE